MSDVKHGIKSNEVPVHSFDQIDLADLDDSEEYVHNEFSGEYEYQSIDPTHTVYRNNRNRIVGFIFMMLANAGFIINSAFIKVAYQNRPDLTGHDVLFIRSILMLPIVYIQAKCLGVNLVDMSCKTAFIVFLRSLTGSCAIIFLFTSIHYLPNSLASVCFNLNPILVSILAFPCLGESISCLNLLCTLGAFGGITMIALNRQDKSEEGDLELFGFVLGVACGTCAAIAYIFMRMMNQKVHYMVSPYYLCIAGYFQVIGMYLVNHEFIHWESYTKEDLIYMCVASLGAILAQIFISVAFKFAEASFLSPMTYMNVVVFFIIDIVYFKSSFYTLDFVGSGIVMVCLALPLVRETISKGNVRPVVK